MIPVEKHQQEVQAAKLQRLVSLGFPQTRTLSFTKIHQTSRRLISLICFGIIGVVSKFLRWLKPLMNQIM